MTKASSVGVLTFHKSINYGSYWQARCLVEGLRARGLDARLLDHECPSVTLAEWRCSLQPGLPRRTPRARLGEYKQKSRKFVDAWRQMPLSDRFSLHDPQAAGTYDAIVVGSDEVWNFSHPWYSHKGIFFGEGLNSKRLISYAATFGNHDAEQGVGPHWAGKLRRFSALSVRDENSRKLVSGAVGTEPRLVLDPCLQFPEVIPSEPAHLGYRYALVYGHGLPDWLHQRVRHWSEARGVRLVSVGYENDWADEQMLSAGPFEFAALVAGAEAMVTNFFHGCVFAFLRGKPLIAAPSEYRRNKIRDLVAALQAPERMVDATTSQEQLEHLLNSPAGQQVEQRIAELRVQSNAYLDAALA